MTTAAINIYPGATYAAAMDAADITVTYDGICFVRIGLANDKGDTTSISVYRDALPDLIERLTTAHAEAVATRVAMPTWTDEDDYDQSAADHQALADD